MPVFKTPVPLRSLLILTTLLGCGIVQDVQGCTNDSSLYFVDEHNIKCIDLKTSNSTYVNMQTVKTGLVEAGAIDIDYRERMIYWSDNALWTINRMNLDTLKTEVLIRDDLGQVDGLAVEWESGLIYWTDYIFERIEVAKLNGTSRKTLISRNLYNPRGIAVDPSRGFMFWADLGTWGKTERADLTGENRLTLRYFYYRWSPISAIIEFKSERIYWMDRHTLFYTDRDGYSRKYLRRYIRENINPVDLALYEDNLYWVDTNSRSIHWFNKTHPGQMLSFGHLTNGILVGAVVSDESRQPATLSVNRSLCSVNNGGCSHLCLLAPGGRFKCACPNQAALEIDGKTCSNVTRPGPPPAPVPDVKVRLKGSTSSHEGRVEVYHQGQWGTICGDRWRLKEATVVCRMLNFSTAVKVVPNCYRYYGFVDYSYVIWMDNVKCRGDEQTIAACRHRGWRNVYGCSHKDDVGIVCRNDSIPPTQGPTLAPGPHPELKVRLRFGMKSNEGRVELHLNGTWGTICDNYWGIEEANVICRMLNYTEGAWSTHCCGWYSGYRAPYQIWLDDVHCIGDEKSIAECRHGGWGNHNCDHSDDVGVVCKYSPKAPGNTVRLADGNRNGEGRVEILHEGLWGTVCDDYWDKKDAQVVCRQLGYSKAVRAPQRAFFGRGTGPIWLTHVDCFGSESSIDHCQHYGWNDHNGYCGHYEDASVICTNATERLDSDHFLLFCEGGRKLCYFGQIQPGHNLPPELTMLDFGITSRCHYWKTAMSYDPIENSIYWSNGCGDIYKGPLTSGVHQAVIRNSKRITDIEIDIVGRNIYFTAQHSNTIRVATLDGSFQTVIVQVQSPQGLALDSTSGFIYFSSTGTSSQITRADMDGKNNIVLANLPNVGSTYIDVALDKTGNRLFFSDKTNNVIRYIDLRNMEILTLLSGNLHRPTSLTMLNNTLYWTAEGYGGLTGAIFKAEAANASKAQMIADGFSYPKGIYVHSNVGTQIPVQSPCRNNGGCSQLCVLIPYGRRCMCLPGMNIAEDKKTCVPGDLILVADNYRDQTIYMSSLNEPARTLISLPLYNITYPHRMAFDALESRIYWTDPYSGVVARSSIDGKNRENIQSNVRPRGIALDLVGGNVYWISSSGATIEVSRLNGDYWKVLVSNVLWANDIVLDTTRGYMYWSSWKVIQRAELDGANQASVVSLSNYDAYSVHSLAMDVDMNRIYFAYRQKVIFIDLNGSTRSAETLIDLYSYGHFYPYLTGVAVDDNYVYFAKWYPGHVYRTNKRRRNGTLESVLSGLTSPRAIVIHKGNATGKSDHPCAKNNGGCTHLCLIKPSGYQCACPTVIKDKRPCSTSSVTQPSSTIKSPTAAQCACPTVIKDKIPCSTSLVTQPSSTIKSPTAAQCACPTVTKDKIPSSSSLVNQSSSTIKSPTAASDYCKRLNPCDNEGTCKTIGNDYKCDCVGYYGGKTCSVDFSSEVVIVYIKGVGIEKFNKTTFIDAIADALNSFCKESLSQCSSLLESAKSISKRAVNEIYFKPEDIYIPLDPKEVNGLVAVEFAVVKATGIPVVVSRNLLAGLIEKKADEIGRKVGGTIIASKHKSSQVKDRPTSETGTKGQKKWLIVGVSSAGGLIVIVAVTGICYFRVKAKRSTMTDNTSNATSRVVSFENPEFDNVSALDGKVVGPAICSPQSEKDAETGGYNNPLYAEVEIKELSPALNNNAGASDRSDDTRVWNTSL